MESTSESSLVPGYFDLVPRLFGSLFDLIPRLFGSLFGLIPRLFGSLFDLIPRYFSVNDKPTLPIHDQDSIISKEKQNDFDGLKNSKSIAYDPRKKCCTCSVSEIVIGVVLFVVLSLIAFSSVNAALSLSSANDERSIGATASQAWLGFGTAVTFTDPKGDTSWFEQFTRDVADTSSDYWEWKKGPTGSNFELVGKPMAGTAESLLSVRPDYVGSRIIKKLSEITDKTLEMSNKNEIKLFFTVHRWKKEGTEAAWYNVPLTFQLATSTGVEWEYCCLFQEDDKNNRVIKHMYAVEVFTSEAPPVDEIVNTEEMKQDRKTLRFTLMWPRSTSQQSQVHHTTTK